jgi:TPR repeat protein
VEHVYPDGPAAHAQIQEGDVLLQLGGKHVDSEREFWAALDHATAGDTMEIEYRHGTTTGKVRVALELPVAVYGRACDLNDALACFKLSGVYREGRGVPKDLGRRTDALKKACDLGWQPACVNYANATRRDGPQQAEQSAALTEQACQSGIGLACFNTAELYRTGAGVPQDRDRALAFYRKACDSGYDDGCAWGEELAAGQLPMRPAAGSRSAPVKVTVDLSQDARTLEGYTTACMARDVSACWRVAMIYEGDGSIPPDAAKAHAFADRACALGYAAACVDPRDIDGVLKKSIAAAHAHP